MYQDNKTAVNLVKGSTAARAKYVKKCKLCNSMKINTVLVNLLLNWYNRRKSVSVLDIFGLGVL